MNLTTMPLGGVVGFYDPQNDRKSVRNLCKSGLELPNCIKFSIKDLHISEKSSTFAASKVKGKEQYYG